MKSFKNFLLENYITIKAYHYTHSEHFEEFQQLSHFGTLNAAISVYMYNTKVKKGTPRLFEVELAFKKLYRLTYAEEEDDAVLYKNTFIKHKHPELEKAWTDDIPSSIQVLKKLGYDGIVYSNTYDDDGSDSYIIFSSQQVKTIKTLAEGDKAIKKLAKKVKWEDE